VTPLNSVSEKYNSEKGFSIKDIDLFLMQTIALVCAFTIEIKDTNINCSTSYPHGCLH
jgi:hypothetical protein